MRARPARSGRGGQRDRQQRGGRRCPWTRLPGEIPKVGLSSFFFVFKSVHHCTLFRESNQLFFRKYCRRGTKIADIADTIIDRQF